MAFHVGQKVVCVDDRPSVKSVPWTVIGDLDGLRKGCVYTIRHIGAFANLPHPLVWLEEIIRPVSGSIGHRYGEVGFFPQRFRPVVERKTDISALTTLLNPANHKKLEDVS